MCGIAGFFAPRGVHDAEALGAGARAMADAIAHRGPDDSATWVDPALGIAFAHRRLSIIDLSPDGRQPMHSPGGRYVTIFNGEIYNFNELRAELESARLAPRWRGRSDTEVFLAACDAWGIEGALQRANGMFALAIADLSRRLLVLARDRMGEKPLYYGWQGGVFLFGSELKAIRRHAAFENRLNLNAIPGYLRFGYVPHSLSIHTGIHKLLPGHLLTLPLPPSVERERCTPYWVLPTPAPDLQLRPQEATERLDAALSAAVRIRLHSDVPLGAFLSGGIDSSTIVALMQEHAPGRVRTYSIGFHERGHDESQHAAAVARALDTEHTAMHVTAEDALAVVPRLASIYDEPFADSSQIPTYLLSRLTRQHVTVALSGDGGDELFGGYVRYLHAGSLAVAHRVVPAALRKTTARLLRTIAGSRWDALLAAGSRDLSVAISSGRVAKLADVIDLADDEAVYRRLVSLWPDPSTAAPGLQELPNAIDRASPLRDRLGTVPWMMYVDQLTYLPDDILVKVDRASMAVALETRVPFLDPDIVSLAASLPLSLKVRNGAGKWLLRQVLHRRLDPSLVARPKQGFAIPLAPWLRGPLRAWAEDLLSAVSLRQSGFFDVDVVRRTWSAHVEGRRNAQDALWAVLMLQDWLRSTRST